jgi:hypothetical protein
MARIYAVVFSLLLLTFAACAPTDSGTLPTIAPNEDAPPTQETAATPDNNPGIGGQADSAALGRMQADAAPLDGTGIAYVADAPQPSADWSSTGKVFTDGGALLVTVQIADAGTPSEVLDGITDGATVDTQTVDGQTIYVAEFDGKLLMARTVMNLTVVVTASPLEAANAALDDLLAIAAGVEVTGAG